MFFTNFQFVVITFLFLIKSSFNLGIDYLNDDRENSNKRLHDFYYEYNDGGPDIKDISESESSTETNFISTVKYLESTSQSNLDSAQKHLNRSNVMRSNYNKGKIKQLSLPHNQEFFKEETLEPIPVTPLRNYKDSYLTLRNIDHGRYIEEDFPCFDLPLVYGDKDHLKHNPKVFNALMTGLNNVFEEGLVRKENADMRFLINSRIQDSKWCSNYPCYGDHTLCYFGQSPKMSSLCKPGYRVEVPSSRLKENILSIINSMRDSLATGTSHTYPHLPKAGNMRQIIYDEDLQTIAKTWLYQCLPGMPPCSSLDGNLVNQLECKKLSELCCQIKDPTIKCVPKPECALQAIIGCILMWFKAAGKTLNEQRINCPYIDFKTAPTIQLIYSGTTHVGCAYAIESSGDVRVICNFSPAAPYYISSDLNCGVISQPFIRKYGKKQFTTKDFFNLVNETDLQSDILTSEKIISLNGTQHYYEINVNTTKRYHIKSYLRWDKVYANFRKIINEHPMRNGTRMYSFKSVTRYVFSQKIMTMCDSLMPIYKPATRPGERCRHIGWRFTGLCYKFSDTSPSYRTIAVLAPIGLFSLILYDLINSAMRQDNY